MADIFISYRRQDSAGYTRDLAKKLAEQYGADSIFRDLENIDAGEDFITAIDEAVSSCKVLIAVIGPQWTSIKDDQGVKRLYNPRDYVRLEIESALQRDIPVIPVTVNAAAWPPTEEIPESLAPLLRRQAHELSDRQGRWDYDTDQLIKQLNKINGLTAVTSLNFDKTEKISFSSRIGKSVYNNRYSVGVGIAIIAIPGFIMLTTDSSVETGQKLQDGIISSDNTEPHTSAALVNTTEENNTSEILPFKAGDKVLATWKTDGCLYPATVLEAKTAGEYLVHYSFSDEAELNESELVLRKNPSEISIAEKIFFALDPEQSKWVSGRITEQRDNKYLVKPDSDTTCRVQQRYRWVTIDELVLGKR